MIGSGLVLFYLHPSRKQFFGALVFALAFTHVSFAAPTYAAEPGCAAIARADTSNGVQGAPQTFDVLANDTATSGTSFVRTSLKLALRSGSPAGSTISSDGKTIIIPGEGRYVAGSDGKITFTPEPDFLGQSHGVRYVIKDTSGTSLDSTYRPTVIGNGDTVTQPPVAVDDSLPDSCYISGLTFSNWDSCLGGGANGADAVATTVWVTSLLANDSAASPAGTDPATVDIDQLTTGIQQSVSGPGYTATYDPIADELTVTVTDYLLYAPYQAPCTTDGCEQYSNVLLSYSFKDTAGISSNTGTVRHTVTYTEPL